MPMRGVSTWLRRASSRRCASVAASVSPAGNAKGSRSRIDSGTARSTSSATDATSSAPSIVSISSGDGPM